MANNTSTQTGKNKGLSEDLNQVLADSYALMSLTHLAHWNVEGPGFFALHTAFQTQYEELFTAIDETPSGFAPSVPTPPAGWTTWPGRPR